MELVLDNDENSDLRTSDTVGIANQEDLGQSSEANSKYVALITYARRFKKSGQQGKKKPHNCSNQFLPENAFCDNNLSAVEPAEVVFRRKKNNDVPSGKGLLAVDSKQNGSVKEGTQTDKDEGSSKVSTDNDSKKVEISGSETNRKAKRRRRKKKRRGTLSCSNPISVSEGEVSGPMKSENIDSVKKIDLHHETQSKTDMEKKNIINQRMPVKEENSGWQRTATIVAEDKNNLPKSPKYNFETPDLKYTYSKRHKKVGQWEKDPLNSSYLNSQVDENNPCNKSLSLVHTAEVGYERKEKDNASFSENSLYLDEKDGGSSMKNMQTFPTGLISPDTDPDIHEMNLMCPKRIRKPRRRRSKKNKTSICGNSRPVSEKEGNGSMKSEIIDSVERSDLYPEISSNPEMRNSKIYSEKTHARGRNGSEEEMPTVSMDDALDNVQSCGVFPKILESKDEDLTQLKCEICIEEKSNDEACPCSSVKNITDDVTSDATIKENITLNYMPMSLPRASIICCKKNLLVLDLNGLLVDVLYEHRSFRRAPIKVAGKSVYKRPFCEEFLEFCFERFDVGVWSSRKKKNIDVVVNYLFAEKRSQLLFCWDLSKCTTTGFNTIENVHKPLVLKELKKLWNKEDEDLPWEKGDYSPLNTLLIDDSPYKALCNPPHTAIFPSPYDHRHEDDNALGLEGDIRVYLEGLAMAGNVQSYVKEHPFGQHPIMPGNPYWQFYIQIIERMSPSFTTAFCHL